MKLVIDNAIPYIKGRLPKDVEIVYLPAKDINAETVRDADALVIRTRTICNEKLLSGSNVKLIVTATIGIDHIDAEWCESSGIKVVNAPGCNAPGVAQYVFASLFKLGFDPERYTLGIIGYGNVGHIIGDWAHQMGIRILVNDPPRKSAGCCEVEYTGLEDVLTQSDAVTLHVPFTSAGEFPTKGMIGERELDKIRCGKLIVNTSRGGVIQESALKNKLREGRFKCVLDVWENEPKIDPELASLVSIGTPHIAGYSEEGKRRATLMALNALKYELGISVDTAGLISNPPSGLSISGTLIKNSYDPLGDSRQLAHDLSKFESLRNNYHYRHEPLYFVIDGK